MAIHSSMLAWRIPWIEEPGGRLSMGSQRTQNWVTNIFSFFHIQMEFLSIVDLGLFTSVFLLVWILVRRQWQPTPVLLPGKCHGRRGLVGCSPWGLYELDTTGWLHFRFSLSCVGEGNGNPLQCSCLENPRDGGAWWAAICGVSQSQTRLKWLSSSSSSMFS